jgi:hypothetical protein
MARDVDLRRHHGAVQALVEEQVRRAVMPLPLREGAGAAAVERSLHRIVHVVAEGAGAARAVARRTACSSSREEVRLRAEVAVVRLPFAWLRPSRASWRGGRKRWKAVALDIRPPRRSRGGRSARRCGVTEVVPAPDEPVTEMIGCLTDMDVPPGSVFSRERDHACRTAATLCGRRLARDAPARVRHFLARAEDQRHALVQIRRGDVEHPLLAPVVQPPPACSMMHADRVRFVDQPQAAGLR